MAPIKIYLHAISSSVFILVRIYLAKLKNLKEGERVAKAIKNIDSENKNEVQNRVFRF